MPDMMRLSLLDICFIEVLAYLAELALAMVSLTRCLLRLSFANLLAFFSRLLYLAVT